MEFNPLTIRQRSVTDNKKLCNAYQNILFHRLITIKQQQQQQQQKEIAQIKIYYLRKLQTILIISNVFQGGKNWCQYIKSHIFRILLQMN